MTELERMRAILRKHDVRHDVLHIKEDDLDNEYEEMYNDGFKYITAVLWANDAGELLAVNLNNKAVLDEVDWLQNSAKLKIFNVRSKLIRVLPEWLQNLNKLEQLHVWSTELQFLPDWLQNFTNLKLLNVLHNQLKHLPDWLQNFTNLKSLSIGGNPLETLPDWLQNFTNLKTFNIGASQPETLPDWLQKLENLEELFIWGNELRILPDWMQKLTKLQALYLNENALQFLPEWIQGFANLHILRIENNHFNTISPALLDLFQRIDCPTAGVTIADVPDDVIKQGWGAIRQYYLEKEEDDNDTPITPTELKVMIIGAGSSGKSSISKAMAGEVHDPNEASTVGIALKNIPLKLQKEDWTLRVWDFGGQEAYAATQTLFMTNNTLYLVVADGRTENRPDPYLHYIKTFAPESPVILIINKVDENERADLNRQVYLDEHKNLHPEMVRFSCVEPHRDKCVEDLRRTIDKVLFQSEYGKPLQMQWKKRWRVIRKDLLELLEQKKTYIDAQDYYEICENRRLPKEVWPIIRSLCNDSGIIFSYTNEEADIDRILHPGWVTQGINTLCTLPESGFYYPIQINKHMRSYGYDKDATAAILQILQTAELAFALPGEKSPLYFIPALLPGEEPDVFPKNYERWSLDEKGNSDSCEMRFRYPFLHPVVKQILMVRMCAIGIDIRAFRYGACWHHHGVRIVMMEKTDDIAFYLQSGNSGALSNEQKFIQGMMEDIHRKKGINGTLYHVFRTAGGGFAEYSNADLWTLKEEMGVDELPLPGIKMKLPVVKILAGFHKTTSERRTDGMSIHIDRSSNVVVAGGDIRDSDIKINVNPTPEQTHFAEETDKAIDIIKGLEDLDQSQKDALIELLKDANVATQENDEEKKKSCKERFRGFTMLAGRVADKVLQALSDVATIVSFFGPR